MIKRIVISLLCIGTVCCRPAFARVQYSLAFSESQAHYADVSMRLKVSGDSTDFKMPVWIPGSYMVREFSRMVESFSATSASKSALKWKKVSKNAWRVYHPGGSDISVGYKVYCFELTVRTSFIDHDRALINGSSVFMYTEASRYDSCQVGITPVVHWQRISTGLDPQAANPFVRVARDYDQLIDCPILIGNHTVFSFVSGGIPHEVAMSGNAEYDSTVLQKDLKAITQECTRIFGGNPLSRYVFIVMNTPSGGGGLEHSNSTVIQVSRDAYKNPSAYKGVLSLAAHEYFHLWLVKRIRDAKLGPFDYDNEVYTTQLWFYEGFTSFYDDYILYRTGIYSEQEYLDIVKGNIATVFNTPGRNYQSLTESSFDAWIKYYRRHENSSNSTVSYYTQGGTTAAMMNLDLLNRTSGARSLDDLMRFLYEKYKQDGKGLTDDDLQTAFESLWGVSMSDFFEKYIYGKEELPYGQYLQFAGLNLLRTDGKAVRPGFTGAGLSVKGGQLIITSVLRGSPAWIEGLNVNDEIISVDTAKAASVKAYLETKMPGDEVIFTFMRNGEKKVLLIPIGEDQTATFEFEDIRKPTALQSKVRKGWLINSKQGPNR